MKSNFGAENGTGLHWVLEEYANAVRGHLEDGTVLTKAERSVMLNWRKNIDNIFENGPQFRENDPKYTLLSFAKADETEKELKEKDVELVESYLQRQKHIYTKEKILGVEKEFNLDLGESDVHGTRMLAKGFMDFVYKIDDTSLEMIDYKFGKKTQDYDEVYNDPQARIYDMALRQLYPGYTDYFLTFDYIREKPITVSYPERDTDVTKRQLIEKWKEIAAPQMINRNVGWHCNAFCINKDNCNKLWTEFKGKFGVKE